MAVIFLDPGNRDVGGPARWADWLLSGAAEAGADG